MIIRERLTLALALAFVLVGSSAMAASPEMTRVFEQGRVLVRDGKYDDAIAKFREALAIEPSVGAWLNIGDCNEKLGRYASAERAFLEAAKLANDTDPQRAAEARARAAHAEASVAWLTLDRAAETTLTLDGEPVQGDRVPVDPGTHRVAASSPRHVAREWSFVVHASETAHLVIALDPIATPSTTTTTTTTTTSTSTLQWVGLGVGAGGLVVSAIGGIFGVIAIGKHSDLENACPGYPRCAAATRSDVQSTYDDGNRAATLSTIALVTGGVLVAGGVVLYLVAPKSTIATAMNGATIRF